MLFKINLLRCSYFKEDKDEWLTMQSLIYLFLNFVEIKKLMTSIKIIFFKLNRTRMVSDNTAISMHINEMTSYIIDNPNFPGFEPNFSDWNLFGFEYHCRARIPLKYLEYLLGILRFIGHLQLDSFVSTAFPSVFSKSCFNFQFRKMQWTVCDCKINNVFASAFKF